MRDWNYQFILSYKVPPRYRKLVHSLLQEYNMGNIVDYAMDWTKLEELSDLKKSRKKN